MPITPRQAKRIAEGLRDHEDFCRRSLTIRNEQGVQVPLYQTPGQIKLQRTIRSQEMQGKPVRIVVLKARQVRMSVGACSQIFKRVAFLPGQQAMVIGHQFKSAKNLFNYVQQFEKSYKPYLGLAKLPLERSTQDQIMEWQGGSRIVFASAETTTSGRSYSFRHLLLSEYAFFRDAATLMTGLMQSVPDDPGTSVIVESTANGLGGPFWDLWQRASDPSVESGWAPMFFAWHEEPKYNRAVSVKPEQFQDSLEGEEIALMRLYRLSPEQINWRRWAIANACEGSVDRFRQEYPSNPEEAFLTSGRPRFDVASIGRMPVVRDPTVGDLHAERVGVREIVQFVPREDGHGALRVWSRPTKGKRYVIGADPSKGLDVGSGLGQSDPDYSVATVHDAATGDQVAVLRERLTPYAFAEYTAALGKFYDTAYIVPEANEMGYIEALLQTQYPVSHLHRRARDADDPRPPTAHEIGWMTTGVSKLQLISALDRALRESTVTVRDSVTAAELRTFVYAPDGKVGGQSGCHDDCVIALALAVIGMHMLPMLPAEEGQYQPQKYGSSGVSNNPEPSKPNFRW